MKQKAWLFKTPLILLFTAAFLVTHHGEKGDLRNPFLRERVFPILRSINGAVTNLKFKIRGSEKPHHKILVLEISNLAVETLGRWPWHRDLIAATVDKALSYGAKVVGLDMVFSEPDHRVPDDLKQLLLQRGIGDVSDSFETDRVLEKVLQANSKRVVTGWTDESFCQPFYSKPEECPVTQSEIVSSFPKGFEKFAIDRVNAAPGFDPTKTPLVSALSVAANLPSYNDASTYSGNFNVIPDADGYIRRIGLITLVNGVPYPTLALAMAKAGLDEQLGISINAGGKIDRLEFVKSGRAIPITPLSAMEINFRGPSLTFPYVGIPDLLYDKSEEIPIDIEKKSIDALPFECKSCHEVTDSEGNKEIVGLKADVFKDAYVLIGVTAVGLYDMRAFPFDSNTAGVEGHATILDNILSGDAFAPPTQGKEWIWVLVLMSVGALGFAYATQKAESIPALLIFAASAGAFWLVDQKLLFERSLINLNTGFLYLEFATLFFLTLATKYVLEERNKKFIKGAFSKYVAPAIVDSILKDPTKLTVGGEKRELTILFSDIRGFTELSEKMDAKALSSFLNDYLGMMTDLVFEHQGTLDKYIGDAVMAFWGAPVEQPKHALNSCRAAVAMMKKLAAEHPRFLSQYGIDLKIGIGINSGQVSVGNMGSDRIFEYTVIGDSVNLASRTEGLTKPYGVSILTTRFTLDCIQKSGETLVPHRVLDQVKVKGKKNAVELIQVLEQTYPTEGLITFEEARQLYIKREWSQAMTRFRNANEILRGPGKEPDGPCEMFLERCEAFRQSPPNADWDGSWEMTSK